MKLDVTVEVELDEPDEKEAVDRAKELVRKKIHELSLTELEDYEVLGQPRVKECKPRKNSSSSGENQ